MRNLNRIAAEILTSWRDNPTSANVKLFSMPYVMAMLDLRTCRDRYGLESGGLIVAYALNNLANWRGETAKRIKAELKQHLETYNVDNNII